MKTLIETAYYGPTHHKGSRIRCKSAHGVTWHAYDYAATSAHESAAEEHARKFAMLREFVGLEEIRGTNQNGRLFVA